MSSLCANRDKYQQAKSRFDKEWRAKTILRFVESLNPHFYPVPIRRSFFQDGSGGGTIEHLSDGFLTRDELSAAHGNCGELLHADNPYRPATTDVSEWHRRFQDWRDKTMTLLRLHTIQVIDQEYQWWVVMRFGSTEPVQAALFQRVDTDRSAQ